MVCAPVRSIIPSLKLGDYLSVQAHKPCSISHLSPRQKIAFMTNTTANFQTEYNLRVIISNKFCICVVDGSLKTCSYEMFESMSHVGYFKSPYDFILSDILPP